MNMVCFLGAQDLLLGRVLRLFLCFEWLYGIEIGCKVGELDGKRVVWSVIPSKMQSILCYESKYHPNEIVAC